MHVCGLTCVYSIPTCARPYGMWLLLMSGIVFCPNKSENSWLFCIDGFLGLVCPRVTMLPRTRENNLFPSVRSTWHGTKSINHSQCSIIQTKKKFRISSLSCSYISDNELGVGWIQTTSSNLIYLRYILILFSFNSYTYQVASFPSGFPVKIAYVFFISVTHVSVPIISPLF